MTPAKSAIAIQYAAGWTDEELEAEILRLRRLPLTNNDNETRRFALQTERDRRAAQRKEKG